MAELSPEILRQIMPTLPKAKRDEYAPMLDICCAEFKINNERRVAAFLASLAVESANLTKWEENLRYKTAKRIIEVWPIRFPTLASAQPFINNPEALANKVYGGRIGNNRADDGWKYRGRFPLQITGKDMYEKVSIALNLPGLLSEPDDFMDNPLIGFRISAWVFAVDKGGNQLADKQQIKALTKRINGGYHGLAERIAIYERALRVLPDDFRITANARLEEGNEIPDFLAGAEENETITEEVPDKSVDSASTEIKTGESEGVSPPVPAVPVETSKPSLLSKISSLSFPAGAGAIILGIKSFVSGIPPWGWIVLGILFVVLCIVGAWLYNESMKRATDRTRMLTNAAADQNKNNIRFVSSPPRRQFANVQEKL